jgi:hypothetical protein
MKATISGFMTDLAYPLPFHQHPGITGEKSFSAVPYWRGKKDSCVISRPIIPYYLLPFQ